MNIRNSFVRQLTSYCMKSFRKKCEGITKKHDSVVRELRRVYETTSNCLVTFSQVHFTKFCKLGHWITQMHYDTDVLWHR